MLSILVNQIYTGVARLIIFVVDATEIHYDWVLAPEISVVNYFPRGVGKVKINES